MSTCPTTRRHSMRAWPRRCPTIPTTTICVPRSCSRPRRARSSRCCRTARRSPSPATACDRWPRASATRPRRRSQIRRGAVVRAVKNAKGQWSLTQVPEVEGAFVSLDPATGAIRALVGGFDYRKSKFNHVTQAWRQPGSSFKPFIYSASAGKGLHARPRSSTTRRCSSTPTPPAASRGSRRTMTAPSKARCRSRRALAKSKNMVSIRVLQAISPAYAREWVTRFGFEAEKHPAYLTMALGAGSVTPLQMASAYGVFANGGFLVAPRLIERLTDSKGRLLQQSERPVLDESMRTLDARNAFVMTRLLQEVTRSGTAARAQAHTQARRTSTARRAPPTTRWTPGSPAGTRAWWRWSGSATTTRRSSVTAKPVAASRCRSGSSTWPRH